MAPMKPPALRRGFSFGARAAGSRDKPGMTIQGRASDDTRQMLLHCAVKTVRVFEIDHMPDIG